MSAITVIYNLDRRPVAARECEAMLDRLAHRGGDGRGLWLGGDVALGHEMRWTTPESLAEKLPFESLESATVITCDARIDNRDELIGELGLRPKSESISDSRIVLAAYERWGEECAAHLVGDFVFAVWDARERKLFCARDPLGVRHFYYYHRPGKFFALASEIKALLALDEVPGELDEEHLADYLVINTEEREQTFYKNVRRLPATHALRVDARGLKTWKYWQPNPRELKLKNDREYQEGFRERFEEAVRCRLRSAFRLGSTLSGGLDSSAVVCVASELLKSKQEKLHTFSAVFPTIAKIDPRIDETRYMQAVIDRTGCEPHFVNVDDASPLQNLEKIMWHADHPVGYLNVYMDSEIFKAAEKENVRVMLTGHDGDATVSYGYEDFEQLARRGRLVRLVREGFALRKNMPFRHHSLKNTVWRRGLKPTVPDSFVKLWRSVTGREGHELTTSSIYYPLHFDAVRPELKARHDLRERVVRYQRASYPDGATPAEHHWHALTNGIFSNMHEQVEKLAAGFGIELRHPFFDRRLIEFCIALPPGQRLYRGWTRSIFRFAMDGILPPEVQWRLDKANLGAYIKINLFKYGGGELARMIGDDGELLAPYVDLGKLRAAYEECRRDPNRRDSEALLLLTYVYFLNWLERSGFADRRRGLPAAVA